ncbi:response regulator [Kordiimonas aestuarii]|uniref:response regulator n=1 Tax=Kordiimonas aestuarii TaxID=1005925 RepID=UPI0021D0D901|nr:response regulator [Kordiimonas aestuarii]
MAPDKLDVDQNDVETRVAALLHQLRTPLLTIKNLTELIGDGTVEAAGVRTDINRQVDRINAELDAFWHQFGNRDTEPGNDVPAGETDTAFVILYVDDDQIHRDIGLRLLEQLGHKVVVCADGVTALELCETQGFDVIFLDEHAPVIRGTDFARGWAKAAGDRDMPYMIGMSNDPRVENLRQACLDAGMQDFMAKPVTGVKLMQVLARAAERLRAS